MFKYTTAIKKLRAIKARKKVIQGGTSAGKTYGIVPLLIDKAIKNPSTKTTIVAETLPAVKEGALDIFKTIMYDTNRWIEQHWNASTLTYTFGNRSRIQFKSYDSVGKAKSSGKRDILFLNEANHIAFDIADALMIRSKETWIDFNPDNEFWAHTEVLKEPNSEYLLLTYHDNEALPKETLEDLLIKQSKAFFDVNSDWKNKDNIKDAYWANWCYVYILGEIGNLEGVIFNNYTIINTLPKEARFLGYGLDFGYTNDPTSIIEVYYYDGKRILNEICYKTGLSNKEIATYIKTKQPCYCDSAEPKSIDELKRLGVKAQPVTKGADSIKFGIQIMQEQQYLVTSNSINLINELRKYAWAKDKSTGAKLNTPIDSFNHSIDAVRYHEMETLGINRKKDLINKSMKQINVKQYLKLPLQKQMQYDNVLMHLKEKDLIKVKINELTYNEVKTCFKELQKPNINVLNIFQIALKISEDDFYNLPIQNYYQIKKYIENYFIFLHTRELELLNNISSDFNQALWQQAGGDDLNEFSDVLSLSQLAKIYGGYPFDYGEKKYIEIVYLLRMNGKQNAVESEYKILKSKTN